MHETDIRFIFKQLRDMNSRITSLEKTLKELKNPAGIVDVNEEWRESVEEYKNSDVEE